MTAAAKAPARASRRHGAAEPRRARRCPAAARSGRRDALAAAAAAAAASIGGFGTGAARAATDYNVRLEDVEDQRTRAAVEAADRGDFALAEQLFLQVVETDPSASAYSNLGNVQNSLGNFADAERNLSEAVARAPDAPVPLLNRAVARQALGKLEEARADCTAAISLDAREFAAWHNRGQIEADMGLWREALDDYTKAADLAPGLAGYRLKQALAAWQVGEEDLSERLLSGLARKYANYAEARAALAAVLWARGREEAAEEQFAAAEFLDGSLSEPGYARAHLWPPEAAEALRRFRRLEV